MGHKTVSCVICGEEVSKRKSLSLKELDGRDGRACKKHPEVVELITKKTNEEQMLKDMGSIAKTIQVMSAASFIRAMATTHGTNPELIYYNFRRNGMPEDIIEQIKAKIADMGGLIMSNDEVTDSIIAYLTLKRKSKAINPGITFPEGGMTMHIR